MNIPELIFATNNSHKADEIKKIIGTKFNVITLADAGITRDIPEPFDTLEENASEKSSVIHRLTNKNCFSEDTGLETQALNGAPGVKSARYAGEHKSDADNIHKLLDELKGQQNRKARFRTVISLILNNTEYFFEGVCNGSIISEVRGDGGFGYDPVFVPDGSSKTFAEMSLDEKNIFSHRRKATDALISFLNKQH